MGSESKSSTSSTSQDYSNSFNTNVAQSATGAGDLSVLSQGAVNAMGATYDYVSKMNSDNLTQTFDTANNQQYSLGANSPITGSSKADGSASGSGGWTDYIPWIAAAGAALFFFLWLKNRKTS